ncbi:hypothetical protein OEZ86_000131 [Tetradesmus obliquus]|nr:hypothetical protein OEZ86_000131 [Tetradesmus obliquus]
MRAAAAVLVALCLAQLLVSSVHAYPRFKSELPAIPVVAGQPWPGVGHVAREGGGKRNAFGKDFDEAGYRWTRELCRMDSDGDGFTNGQELGDPDCTWVKGQPQRTAAALSHPGLAKSVPAAAQPAAASAPPAAATGNPATATASGK